MTVIVGITDGDKVYMGSDSLISGENEIQSLNTPKIIKKECIQDCGMIDETDTIIIGVSGTLRGLQLLQYQWNPPVQSQDQTDDEYIHVSVLNSIHTLFIEYGAGLMIENQDQHPDNFLIGYKGRLYILDPNYQLFEVTKPYIAIGSGAAYALGSLNTNHNKIKSHPLFCIENAVGAAIEFCPTCGGEIKIYEVGAEGTLVPDYQESKIPSVCQQPQDA